MVCVDPLYVGPVSFTRQVWDPVRPAEQSSRGDLVMHPDKDRRGGQLPAKRRRPQEDPDADEFQHKPSPEESGEADF